MHMTCIDHIPKYHVGESYLGLIDLLPFSPYPNLDHLIGRGGMLTDAALSAAAPVLEYVVLSGSASAVDPESACP